MDSIVAPFVHPRRESLLLLPFSISEGFRSQISKRAVRALRVVVDSPVFDLEACTRHGWEAVLGEALVAEAAVEALDVCVLGWFAGLDEVQNHAVAHGPVVQRHRDELGPVVDAKRFRKAVTPHESVEHAHNSSGGERGIDLNRVALAREGVDDVERAQLPSVREMVADEVHRPALIRAHARDARRWPRDPEFPARASSHREARCAIDAVDRLAVDVTAFATKQCMQSPVAKSGALARELAKSADEHLVIDSRRLVAACR